MRQIDDDFIGRAFESTTPPKRRPLLLYFVVGLLLAFLFVPALRGDDFGLPRGAMIAIPAAFALGIMGGVAGATRRQRMRREFVTGAWESVQLEEWEAAERVLAEGLTRPIGSATDRCQAFLALAAIAEKRRDYDAAIEIYKHLLLNRIGEPNQLQLAQIAMTSAKLRNEELTDGIQMLDRLEKLPMPMSLKAGVAWIRLYQQVFMGQFEDAVRDLDEIRELFRRFLSTRAGYAYALIAKALHQLGNSERAAEYWRDATTLVRPERLTEEYPFLQAISLNYSAEDRPC